MIRHSRPFMMALVASVTLLVVSYFFDSWPYSVGGELSVGQWIERGRYVFGNNGDHVPDSVLLINVAYDKTLLPYRALVDAKDASCSLRQAVGEYPVTDRRKLLAFLSAARRHDNYRYMIVDIRFEEGFTDDDATRQVFTLIKTMDRLVIAKHQNVSLADSGLLAKAAYADYNTLFLETDLVKYPLTLGGEPTLPMKMYQDLSGASFSSVAGVNLCNGHLCRGSIFLTYPIRVTRWQRREQRQVFTEVQTTYTPQYYNLGQDILTLDDRGLHQAINGKIVVIGDFVDDIHDTYVGPLPGAVANLDAYVNLTQLNHEVHLIPTLLLFLIYVVMAYTIIRQKMLFEYIRFFRDSRSYVMKLLLSFIGYSLILTILATFYYLYFGEFYSIVFPACFFTLLGFITKIHYHTL